MRKNGYTGVKGLFACGECAGGMHGANRVGGTMVYQGRFSQKGQGRGRYLYLVLLFSC